MRFLLFTISAALVAGGYGMYTYAGWQPVPGGPAARGAPGSSADLDGRGPTPAALEPGPSGLVRYVTPNGQIGLAQSLDAVPQGATVLPGQGYAGAALPPEEAAARDEMRRRAARLRHQNMRVVDSVESRARAAARLARAKQAAARRATRETFE